MKKTLVVLLTLALALGLCLPAMAANESGYPDIEINFLHCWNGGGAGLPADQSQSPVCQEIYRKTGVILNMTSITSSETERLNLMFSTGEMPDLVNAPFWSNTSGEGLAVTNAAIEGLLYDIKPLLETGKYPNVQKLFDIGVSKDFLAYDIYNPAFNGKVCIIPQQTPTGDVDSVTNWTYGVYCRKDILAALNVDPTTVTTAEGIYDLAVKIRDGGFTDINGNAVIPCGTVWNGCSYDNFYASFRDGYHVSAFRLGEDGKITSTFYSDSYDKTVLYMRKMVAEGLMDVECFDQTSSMAEEKLATGKVAMFAYQNMVDYLKKTLYMTNPEMEYALVGPQVLADGSAQAQVEQKGRAGFPVMVISAGVSAEKADAILRFLDYMNSLDGWKLAYFGIEGDTCETGEDGIPRYTQSYYDRKTADSEFTKNYGLDFFGNFIGADNHNVIWADHSNDDYYTALKYQFEKDTNVVLLDGINISYLLNDWEGYDAYKEKIATLDFDRDIRGAFFAATDEEALAVLESERQLYRNAGLDEMLAWLTEAYNTSEYKDQIIF